MPDNFVLSDIMAVGWKGLRFEPFKPGISIHWLAQGEPAVALLKYEPGARAPLHFHPATESVLILDGAQSDALGTYQAGDFVLNFKGSQHEVWSETGCVALLQRAKPVQFL